MKRGMIFAALFLAVVAVLTAQPRTSYTRLAGDLTVDFLTPPQTAEDVQEALADRGNFFTGLHWERIVEHVGFGNHLLFSFPWVDPQEAGQSRAWWMDWNADLFLSYHLFGGGAFLDPNVQLGYGVAGRAYLGYPENAWVDPEDTELRMTLYPYAAAGLTVNLDGFFVGGRLAFRPDVLVSPVYGTNILAYPLKSFQFGIYGGVSFERFSWYRR